MDPYNPIIAMRDDVAPVPRVSRIDLAHFLLLAGTVWMWVTTHLRAFTSFGDANPMSTPRQTVARCLEQLRDKWKQDFLFLDEQGYCSLRTDDQLDVLLEVKDESSELLFVADLSTRLTQAQAAHLLHLNLYAEEMRFATFCRERSDGRAFTRYHYPVDSLTDETLGALITNFVEVSRWARELVQALADGKMPDVPDPHLKKRGEFAQYTTTKLLEGRTRS